jgi:ABC-type nitrate/sulfonate/bicarbonate transport system ATPase subunit
MTVLLHAQHIRRSFTQPDGTAAAILGGIDLDLIGGQVTCLLGASGCGKTTLLRILAGFDSEYDGSIDTHIRRPGPDLGYLSQNDRLLPWRTAAANVRLGLELTGRPTKAAHQEALKALTQVGLTEAFADHRPAQLSGGMQQRVLLARMLALQPKLLLLDEPMSSLDLPARRDLAQIIRHYTSAHNAATLVVTHSVEEACFLADRILLVSRSPALIGKEIILTDTTPASPAELERGQALDSVMRHLLHVLGQSA